MGSFKSLGRLDGRTQPARVYSLSYEFIQSLFHHRRAAGIQHAHFRSRNVHAAHGVAFAGKTRRSNATNVAKSKDCDFHDEVFIFSLVLESEAVFPTQNS